jgi:hypothetical protein
VNIKGEEVIRNELHNEELHNLYFRQIKDKYMIKIKTPWF